MIREPAVLFSLFPHESVTLEREATEARLAIRRKILTPNPGARLIDDDMAAVDVVTELILNRGLVVSWREGADEAQGDPPATFEKMKRVGLPGGGASDLAVVLEEAV